MSGGWNLAGMTGVKEQYWAYRQQTAESSLLPRTRPKAILRTFETFLFVFWSGKVTIRLGTMAGNKQNSTTSLFQPGECRCAKNLLKGIPNKKTK
jgi:hypothetical protein